MMKEDKKMIIIKQRNQKSCMLCGKKIPPEEKGWRYWVKAWICNACWQRSLDEQWQKIKVKEI